jgi:hypothetical protein
MCSRGSAKNFALAALHGALARADNAPLPAPDRVARENDASSVLQLLLNILLLLKATKY